MTDVPILSGNEITDAVRRANVQGDGLLPEQGSTGIWEATTNLNDNGGFETNASGISTDNCNVVSSTDYSKFGSRSLKATSIANGNYQVHRFNIVFPPTFGIPYTVSVWVRGEAGSIGDAGRLVLKAAGGANPDGDITTPVDFTFTGEWQRYVITGSLDYADRTTIYASVYLYSGTAGESFYMDGLQSEQQPIATPYVETDGATATRNAARAQAPASALDETQGWVATRIRMGFSTVVGNPRAFEWSDGGFGGTWLAGFYDSASWKPGRHTAAGGIGTGISDSFSSGDLRTVIFKWTATQIGVSVQGSAFTLTANTDIPVIAASSFDILRDGSAVEFLDSDAMWFAAGSGTLTDADANLISRFNNDPIMADFPGSPTWFWESRPTPQVLTVRRPGFRVY